jgi:hypothetical protein
MVRLVRRAAQQDFLAFAQTTKVKTPFFDSVGLQEADDQNGALVGVVAVLPYDEDKVTEAARRELLVEVDNAIADAIADRAAGSADRHIGIAPQLLAKVAAEQSNLACYMLRFALFRTGELRLWFSPDSFLGRGVSISPSSSEEDAAMAQIPPQVYFFLKDLLHAHYHHDQHSDQLLPLTRLATATDDIAIKRNEVSWRYATLRGLARVVAELRQGRSLPGHKRALGVIAYAQAFQSVLAVIARPPLVTSKAQESSDVIKYDFANLAMSIEAGDTAAESSNGAKLQFFAIEIGVFLSALALWSGAVQILPDLCAAQPASDPCPKIQPGPVVSIVRWIVANPIGFCVGLVVVGFCLFVWVFRGTGAIKNADRTVRWFSKLSDALATQVSRWSKGSDILGYLSGLAMLLAAAGTLIYTAYRLLPKTEVPAIKTVTKHLPKPSGPWASLNDIVGRRADESGLFAKSVIAPEIRAQLGADYVSFLSLMRSQPLARSGSMLYMLGVAPDTAAGDSAYLLVDPLHQRIEAGVRRDGLASVHHTPGPRLSKPAPLVIFLRNNQFVDAGPVAIETATCESKMGGLTGRTLHLSGAMLTTQFCDFNVDLRKGQRLEFNRRKASGLALATLDANGLQLFKGTLTADSTRRYVVRVAWTGPLVPHETSARPFYVRLDIR